MLQQCYSNFKQRVRLKALLLTAVFMGLVSCCVWFSPAHAEYPAPPAKVNAYEAKLHRGIWDYNFTDAKSGLFWSLHTDKDSTGKSGTEKGIPDYPRLHYPTDYFLWATFQDVEQLEQTTILTHKADPTRTPIKVNAPIVDMFGRNIPVGVYSVALRMANPNPPATVEDLGPDGMATTAVTGSVATTGLATDSAKQTLVYPANDMTRQTQVNPFGIQNPRISGSIRQIPSASGSSKRNSSGAVPLGGMYLVVKHQGVVKGVLPVTQVGRYSRKRRQEKANPSFALMDHDFNGHTRLALFYKSSVYQTTPGAWQPQVLYPTTTGYPDLYNTSTTSPQALQPPESIEYQSY